MYLREQLRQHNERIAGLERRSDSIDQVVAENMFLREQLRQHNERIAGLERRSDSIEQVVAENMYLREQLPQHNERIAGLERRSDSIDQVVAENMFLREQLRQHNERIAGLERRSDSIEHQLALRNVILANLEENISQQEFRRYDGQLLWKIREVARKRSKAVSGQLVSLFSPFFYTSTCGYKVCGQIYLNGNDTGQGTHISLYFVIMRGENDATLRWPFRQKFTFIMFDQDNVKHVIKAFTPDSNSSAFQRPGGRANIGIGCPRFCSLTELNNHAYVRDDTMLLKIIVDTTDL